jgi:hypothetical protein
MDLILLVLIVDVDHAPQVEAVFSQRARLVEANKFQFAADVYPGRTNAVDLSFFQPTLGVDGAHCHGGRQSWRHYDGYYI